MAALGASEFYDMTKHTVGQVAQTLIKWFNQGVAE